jgi:hypothetical protein
MKSLALALLLASAVLFTGCATIMQGGPDHVQVVTNPPGASVYLDDALVGQTPTVVTLDREHSQGRIRVEATGYAPIVIQRSKHINGWFWANLCLGGVVGIVIDLATGDIKGFDNTPINAALTPAGGAPPAATPMTPAVSAGASVDVTVSGQ